MNEAAETCYDIAIIGGGMVGIPLALGLAERGFNTLLLEQHRFQDIAETVLDNSFDLRSTAISLGSAEILAQMNLWDEAQMRAQPISTVHVSEQGRMGTTRIESAELDLDALGYVVPNMALGKHFQKALLDSAVHVRDQVRVTNVAMNADCAEINVASLGSDAAAESGAINSTLNATLNTTQNTTKNTANNYQAKLVIIADGASSQSAKILGIDYQSKDYGQHAIIANVRTELDNQGVAFERFSKTGPAALLPLKDDVSALVWTLDSEQAEAALQLNDQEFAKRIEDLFGGRLGRILTVGERASYPLVLRQAKEQCRDRLLVVGNAAHSLHPVAGQGFNLALRGLAAYIEGLTRLKESTFWSRADLDEMVSAHRFEQFKIVNFSDQLIELFSPASPVPSSLKSAGLVTLNSLSSLKSEFAKHTMGRAQPFTMLHGA